MAQETMAKIFDPYFTTKEQGQGSGLGLAVVRGIVESHSGWITVQSEPGKGSTFLVYLPVIVCEKVEETQKDNVAPVVVMGHGRVMVVDDESSLREMLSEILTEAGYQVDTFTTGLEAWEALAAQPRGWDLLLTDQTMPGMTGDQLAFKALGLRPDLPVILCSGYSPTLKIEDVKRAGVFACLEKPLDFHTLLSLVATALAVNSHCSAPTAKVS